MKNILVLTTVVLSACSTAAPAPGGAQTATPVQAASPTQISPRAQAPTSPQEQAAPGTAPTAAATDPGLNDLNAITFNCAKVGLNAAAREATHKAAEVRAKGSYQFSYFRLVSSSHHSTYEVHFKSNNYEDQDLKYCVDVYCQQGWDPKTANPTVRPMDNAARPTKAGAAGAERIEVCSEHQAHMKQPKKR